MLTLFYWHQEQPVVSPVLHGMQAYAPPQKSELEAQSWQLDNLALFIYVIKIYIFLLKYPYLLTLIYGLWLGHKETVLSEFSFYSDFAFFFSFFFCLTFCDFVFWCRFFVAVVIHFVELYLCCSAVESIQTPSLVEWCYPATLETWAQSPHLTISGYFIRMIRIWSGNSKPLAILSGLSR